MMKFRANIFEIILAAMTFLSVVGLGFYFYDLVSPSLAEDNPFKEFDSNSGIIRISVAAFIARVVFLICFIVLSTELFENARRVLIVYLLSALIIGFLQWFELYYGSTFYYGEVRDKQGLMFPILASLMATLIIWKMSYSGIENSDTVVKVLISLLVNAGLYFLWTQVYEPWNLWQS